MQHYRYYIFIFVFLFCGLSAKAQYDPSFSHYYDMETSFNPAAAGKEPYINVTAAYALDMAGFEHNPRTAYVSGDMPFRALKAFHGAGLNFMNDQIGLFTHTKLELQYACQLKLFGGQMTISPVTIVTVLANIVIMVALTLFTGRTKKGKAMRAVSEDKGAAQLMGINVNGTISLTFAIGSGLAAIAGVLLCSAYPTLMPTTGSMPGIKAFTAAVLGGIGSIPGAMLGGILLGVIEIFGKAYISTQLSDAIVFAVLIIVLLIKPTGLLGKKISEKV